MFCHSWVPPSHFPEEKLRAVLKESREEYGSCWAGDSAGLAMTCLQNSGVHTSTSHGSTWVLGEAEQKGDRFQEKGAG